MEPEVSDNGDQLIVDPDRSEEGLQRLLYRRRLAVFGSEAVLSIMPLLVGMIALLWVFWGTASHLILTIWATAVVLQILSFLVAERRLVFDEASLDDLRRHWQTFMVLECAGTLIWAAIFPYLAWYAQGLQVALIALVGAGVLAGVLLVHRTAPFPAMFHVVVVSISLTASAIIVGSTQASPAILLIAAFGFALLGVSRQLEREFVRSAITETERRESSSLVKMLLNDYEEQSSDWLWTVGPKGNLRDVSERFATAAGLTPEELEGSPITQLFPHGEQSEELARCIVERRPFHELILALRVNGEKRFWRLSARPRDDGRMSGVARDVTADRLIEERVAFMAHYDNLTGLANRYLFNERLRAQSAGDSGEARNFALFYLDLDDFKAINDTRGHIVGDRLLREVGTRLEQEVRNEDLVARLGGDEFAVLIETRAGDGLLVERAHRFLSVIRAPYEIDGTTYRISSSIGIARCNDGDCAPDEIMRRADLALYAAKAKGRDNLALFEPDLDRKAREKRKTEADLADALRMGQMQMYYQPVVSLNSGELTGFEALLRWEHPERGLLAPTDFLDAAEEIGFILPLGEWVIRQALSDVAAMPGNLRIAINLSPTQVKNPNLVATVAQAIHATNVAPERVELEITEHVFMDEDGAGHATLMRLRELGVRIALDDFGTGYSSLGYLRRFPFDRIKIDRTFVTEVTSDLGSQAIVSTITRLADALGMDTTAEGIEDPAQLELLRKLGVEEAQGYMIARPVPPEGLFEKGASGNDASVRLAEDFSKYRLRRVAVTAGQRS